MHWDHEPLIIALQRESADKSDALQTLRARLSQWTTRQRFGVRASSAPLSHGSPRFDDSAGLWRASFRFGACIGTMNLIVLLLVLVLETKPLDRGRERQRGRGRKGGSWEAPSTRMPCIGTMN